MHEAQPLGMIVRCRYRLLKVLGRGSSGITYEAEDTSTMRHVALKELSLRGLSDWKKLELFKREAKILANLNHPGIPQYIDYFEVDIVGTRFFYIAQEIAEGQSLADLIIAGERFPESEVRRIGLEILQVLQYLQGLNPPVIHRDIKPQNIVRRQDGQIFLVDFGAVQMAYRSATTFGSTVVGTYGYMAPEQFHGQAYPTTDLYSLGMTLLSLLSHQLPNEFPQQRLKIDFRPYVRVSEAFAIWLDGLIDPHIEDRFDLATTAIAALTNPLPDRTSHADAAPKSLSKLRPQPVGSRVHLTRKQEQLSLHIPPLGFQVVSSSGLIFAILWNCAFFHPAIISSAIKTLGHEGGIKIIYLACLFWAWYFGLCLLPDSLNALFLHVSFEVKDSRFKLTYDTLGWKRIIKGYTKDLEGVKLLKSYQKNGKVKVRGIALRIGIRTYRIGTKLSTSEKRWLAAELEAFLEDTL